MTDNVESVDDVNPDGVLNSTGGDRIDLYRAAIEYMAGKDLPEKLNDEPVRKGLITLSNQEGPYAQVKTLKGVWIATRVLMKYASAYGETPQTYCGSYDGRTPSLGTDQLPGPCSRIEEGNRIQICKAGLWKVACPGDPTHENNARAKECQATIRVDDVPRKCEKKLKRIAPDCKMIVIGLFYNLDMDKLFHHWTWKTSVGAMRRLLDGLTSKQGKYEISKEEGTARMEVTLTTVKKGTYFVSDFPERLPEGGTDGWRKISDEEYAKVLLIKGDAVANFNAINFIGTPNQPGEDNAPF